MDHLTREQPFPKQTGSRPGATAETAPTLWVDYNDAAAPFYVQLRQRISGEQLRHFQALLQRVGAGDSAPDAGGERH